MQSYRATPAIATQAAVQRLPRWALPLLCLAYIIPGFVGRGPWKNADVAAFGVMSDLAVGLTDWFNPTVLGSPPDTPALIPYWLGAWSIQLLPAFPDVAVRIPFMLAVACTFFLTWHAVFRFALLPSAQPVTFAFGGEAHPVDYARSLADGGLLALLACLGLAQLSHETTPAVIQLLAASMLLRAMAGFADPAVLRRLPAGLWLAGLALMSGSGAPTTAVVVSGLPLLACAITLRSRPPEGQHPERVLPGFMWVWAAGVATSVTCLLMVGAETDILARALALDGADVTSLGQLFFWFTWPVWPLALWTLWRWRRHIRAPHLQGPVWLACALVWATAWAPSPDRTLLLSLPVLSLLAAFSLPTLKRSFAALVDWFSVLFFTLCAVTVWVVWLAMLTGVPAKPAANVSRLAPGFALDFSFLAFAAGAAATLVWLLLVRWRLGRHPPVIWKSLVLAATGSTLCWLLLMTLWMPLLDFARSYGPISRRLAALLPADSACTEAYGLSQAQAAGLVHHGKLQLRLAPSTELCATLVVAQQAADRLTEDIDITQWAFKAKLSRLTDNKESLLLFQRVAAPAKAAVEAADD